MYPKALSDLINDFKKLPGVGEKSAERFSLFITSKLNFDEISEFSNHLINLNQNITTCPNCHTLIDKSVGCTICSDQSRDKKVLMIVEDSKDVFLLEKLNVFKGYYHVIGGLIDYIRGIDENKLSIKEILKKVSGVEEIILALSQTLEGETTSRYIKSLLRDTNINITKLASGIPYGADIKYTDEVTLTNALKERKEY
jgi:recombination protein RecR